MKYMDALRETMKGLLRGTVVTRARVDLRPSVQMATSGRHSIFFEANGRNWTKLLALLDLIQPHPGAVLERRSKN